MKKMIACLVLISLLASLPACSGYTTAVTMETDTNPNNTFKPADVSDAASNVTVSTQSTSEVTPVPIAVEYEDDDLASTVSDGTVTVIKLNGDTILGDGSGVTVEGSIVTITDAGTYNVSGTLNDGQIIVDTEDEETVVLVLNGVNITSGNSAPIYVRNAEKVVITLAAGTENYVTDSAVYVFEDETLDEPNAAIFSKDDLTINGDGALTVNANYNNGIASKDDLKITGGNLTVNAVNDGIKGKDSIAVLAGALNVVAGSDGLQASNSEDAEKGYVAIEGGSLNVTADLDAIQAETSLLVSGGDLTLVAGAGQSNAGDSAKGLKAGVALTISGGKLSIVTPYDDAMHSNNSITIDGGDIVLATGDDGIRADASLVINGGTVDITEAYEGLESGVIIINDGTIHMVTSDDGINVSAGSASGMMGGPGESVSSENYLEINGGYVYVDAGGDGLDSNGMGFLNGGVVIVNGPTMNGNGALDVNGMLEVNAGFLVAVGSAGMAQSPSSASTQYSVLVSLPEMLQAGNIVHIESESGEEILTFTPTKAYQTVVISSPELEHGSRYVVYAGGQASGTLNDGLYTDATYTAGTQVSNFTIASIVTGESSGMGMRTGGPGRDRP